MKLLVIFALVAFSQGSLERKQRTNTKGGTIATTATFESNANIVDIPSDEDILTINQKFPGLDLLEGDIQRRPTGRNSIIDTTLFWPNTTIPIQFSTVLNLLAISGIEDARQEYEMRTCFSFPDRTDETDYLLYQPRSGCWSSVGVQHGPQVISIGSGCEKQATIQHEMMHAIGIYHEQSRTDRDGYIIIETENIDPDLVYNFDKYGYDIVDDRRVPYDFNSVMHYGETAFSNNGEKTIVTRDPQFQNLIGQRRTFSEGDVALINRMYNCADPLRVSYSCNFDDAAICGYVQDQTDNLDWVHYIIGETDGKLISPNLPLVDNTLGKQGQGTYMVLDTSEKVGGQNGILVSMRMKSRFPQQCLEFGYYMDLETGSDAAMAVYLGAIDQSTGDVLATAPLVTILGDNENYWNMERLTIKADSTYKLIIAAKASSYDNDVIAIDDISILDKPCEDAFFVINDFSELLASTPAGEGVYSPTLYSNEGYAFRVLFFPHGSSSSVEGYVGMYFGLVQGDNDDSLQWPFYNRVIRITVVDQGPEAVSRMSEYLNFMTSESNGGAVWDKPTSEPGSSWGYANFMKLSDITDTRNFLKNDGIVISVSIRNMNSYVKEHAAAFDSPLPSEPVMKSADVKGVNIDVIVPHDPHHHQDDTSQEDTVAVPVVVGIAFAAAVVVFLLMSVLIVCINQSHKSAMTAIMVANERANRSDTNFNNACFDGPMKA